MPRSVRKELITVAVLFALLILVALIPVKGFLKLVLHLIPFFLAGFAVFCELAKKIEKKKIFNEYLTVTAAAVLAVVAGEYAEAVVIILLFRLCRVFCNFARREALKAADGAKGNISDVEQSLSLISKIFIMAMTVIALIVFLIGLIADPSNWRYDLYRGVILIAVSTPIALTFSVPLAYFAGIGKAAVSGIRIKSSYAINKLSSCTTFVFEKNGILTDSGLTVNSVHPEKIDEKQLIELARLAFSHSDTAIARCIAQMSDKEIDASLLGEVRNVGGMGCIATMSGKLLAAGNEELMKKLKIDTPECHHPDATVIHIALGQVYLGHIAISDNIRAEADKALYRLRSAGVKSIVMLTEDKMSNAAKVADTLHAIDEFYPALSWQDKVRIIENIVAETAQNETLAFAGNLENNGEVFSFADVGITVNGEDSDDVDVVINDSSLEKLPLAVNVSSATILAVKENLIAIGAVKLITAVLGVIGIISLPTVAFIDVAVILLTALNSLRIMK